MSYLSETLPKLVKLELALKRSWNKKTCYPFIKKQWTAENPAFGQCAVTALIVQDFFGGEILFCKHQNHFWNQMPDNAKTQIDLTRSQFPSSVVICFDSTVVRQDLLYSEAALKAKTLTRYLRLRKRVMFVF